VQAVDVRRSLTLWAALALAVAPAVQGWQADATLSSSLRWLSAGIGLVASVAAWAWANRRPRVRRFRVGGILGGPVVIAFVAGGWAFAIPLLVNRFADSSPRVERDTTLRARELRRSGRAQRMVLTLDAARPGETLEIGVRPSFRVAPELLDGPLPAPARVNTYEGALGFEWVASITAR
jgi:hypothetical protein